MVAINLTHLNLAGRAYKGFAVLALDQFLRGGSWKAEDIPPETVRNIEKAISFIELALKGRTIVKTAEQNRSFPSDFPAIRAYNICTMAYELSGIRNFSFNKTLVHSRNILKKILEKEPKNRKLSLEEENLIIRFIQGLGKELPAGY